MDDPTTIESGRTFECELIEKYFEEREKAYKEDVEANLSRLTEDENVVEADYYTCPINLTKVDPKIMIQNELMKSQIEEFLESNHWGYKWNPITKYMDVKLFDD